jgi:transcription initiation factor TFIIB
LGAVGGIAPLPGKLGITNSRANRTSDRNMAFALAYIRRLCGTLGLPQTAAIDAITHYRRAASLGLVGSRNIEVMACAIIFHVTRELGCARLMKEVCRTAGIEAKDGFRMYRTLARCLKLKPVLVEPEEFVHRFANGLGLSEQAKTRALEMVAGMRRSGCHFNGASSTIAAAAVYAAGLELGEHHSFNRMAKALGVSQSCVRAAVPLVNTGRSTATQERHMLATMPDEMLASRMMCFTRNVTRHRPLLYADFLQQAEALFR